MCGSRDPQKRRKSKMKNIYIANLSFGTTEQTVRSLFEAYGTVDRVSIVTDRDTGQPKGFGFVEMPNDAEAEKAIAAVNGKDVGGRTLAVNEARPKTDRPSGGGGRRPSGRDRFNREAPKPFPNRQVLT
jgi:cold-inducible RNA-binding protein